MLTKKLNIMILFKDLIKIAHKLGIHTKGLTYSQILKHVNNHPNYKK